MTTIKDIAKEAGVSLMTVSRVINETHLVKKETVDKVNEAINKICRYILGYVFWIYANTYQNEQSSCARSDA